MYYGDTIPDDGRVILQHCATRDFVIAADFGISTAFLENAVTEDDLVLDIFKNGTQIGTLTFALGENLESPGDGQFGTFAQLSPPGDMEFTRTDRLTIRAPVTPDDHAGRSLGHHRGPHALDRTVRIGPMLVMTLAKYRPRVSYLATTALTNVNSFGGLSIGPDTRVLAQSVFANTSQFGSLAVTPAPNILLAPALNNVTQFGTHTVDSLLLTLAHTAFTNSQSFGDHQVENLTPPPTSYANPDGTGDRTGTITASSSSGLFGAGNINKLINGNTVALDCWFNGSASSPYMKFDFGTARRIDAFKWYQSNNSNHGTWKWQGSDDDSSYGDVGSSFTLDGPVGGGMKEFTAPLSGNPSAYRYWKLVQVSGTTNGGPYIYEIEFKIY